MKKFVEGSHAIAEVIAKCRPGVISAYPITPQTHIVEGLAKLIADGELDAEFINVESEHSAASVVLGGSAAGVRTYTATSSQGLLLMAEVIFNIAGMRLPVVLTCANRAVSAPINIWNDHQDSMTVRDSGWIHFYAENIQEAIDLHIIAYKVAEDKRVSLPVLVGIDGYVLTHAFEVVDMPEQELVDKFLPKFEPIVHLDPDNPVSMGLLGAPDVYIETRYAIEKTMQDALSVIEEVSKEYSDLVGRKTGGLIEGYKIEDAEKIIVAIGSIVGSIKDVVDELREKGEKVGVLKIITYRPFPKDAVYEALKNAKYVAVAEKAVSLGADSPIFSEIAALMYKKGARPLINSFTIGLGGRDISPAQIGQIFADMDKDEPNTRYIGLNEKLLEA